MAGGVKQRKGISQAVIILGKDADMRGNDDLAIALGRLAQLACVPGVSGRENQVAELISEQISAYVDSVHTDALGNVIARREGKGPILMLEAHMDEVGFMVQAITPGGYIKFLPVGPILEPPVIGQRMHLHTPISRIDCVVGYNQDCGKDLGYRDMHLDTGYSADELLDIAKIGDVITFRDGITNLANGLIAGKAMDNRTGVFVLLELARRLADEDLGREVAFCFSVRHEVGALGIPAIVSAVQPKQAIVLDVALSSDYPHGVGGRLGKSDLNGGPILWRGVDLSESMATCIEGIAAEKDIKAQMAAWNRFTPTNASYVMKVAPAVQTTLLSIPRRYPHGPNGVVATRDIANLIELLELVLQSGKLNKCLES